MIGVEDIKNDIESHVAANTVSFENVFIPSWANKPPEQPAVLSLADIPILTYQNVSAIIAAQGMGKTSVMEAICATHISEDCDTLGFAGSTESKGIIYCDFERTNLDVWNSFYRVAKRANVPYGGDLSKVLMIGMRSVPRPPDRKALIVQFLEDRPCSILLLDGAGDLVTDVNDLQQAIECRIWLRELTVKYGVSIFTTLHPNPGQEKPRGHLGSEILRECEAVMLIKNQDGVRTISTEFEHGKNRNNAPANSAFAWDDEHSMFKLAYSSFSVTTTNNSGFKKLPEAKEFSEGFHALLLNKVFSKESILKSGDFHNNLMSVWDSKDGGEMKLSRAKKFYTWYTLNDYVSAKPGNKGNITLNSLTDKMMFYRPSDTVGQVADG